MVSAGSLNESGIEARSGAGAGGVSESRDGCGERTVTARGRSHLRPNAGWRWVSARRPKGRPVDPARQSDHCANRLAHAIPTERAGRRRRPRSSG